ncbi:hypothetical protein [Sandaracinus amylolyticus]|uniref:hypothetical protein n=1 Tax=Sandaracinus amylolyticus TaxID=927083 RepID=UPI001F174617|nr:hypothetical protein [Sandaracinus amylolyticus]UJR83172.1 Hypothetical protein I5071_52380 [Sandaracinus amylolyticus]
MTISENPTDALRRVVAAVVFTLLGGCGAETLGEGESCTADTECGVGACVELDGRRTCSIACAPGDACPDAFDGSARTCRESSYCGAPCTFTGSREGQACRDGAVVECASLEPADACSDCGCAMFGGGICVAGTGCVQPGPEGAACTEDRFCESGLCDPASGTCVAPSADGEACAEDRFCQSGLCNPLTDTCTSLLAAGAACDADRYCASGLCGTTSRVCVVPGAIDDPCSIDRECQSQNCSTDGDATRVGVCRQPLGEECDVDHCNRCVGRDLSFGFPGYCSRSGCDPVTAPCGPPVGAYNRRFDCRASVDGPYYCYETCPTDQDEALGYNCLDDFDLCHWQTGSCY